jgi:hypothetical protein
MNDDQYQIFEEAAKPAMQRAMLALHTELKRLGLRCSAPSDIDHDIERGIGLEIHYPGVETPIGVEMLLTDGDERAFTREPREPACGLLLSVIGPEGLFLGEWSPYNYSDAVGTSDPSEIVRRVGMMVPTELAEGIHGRIVDWSASEAETEAAAPRA